MVEGIDSFRDKFRDYTDCCTVIGGAACDILMSEAERGLTASAMVATLPEISGSEGRRVNLLKMQVSILY